MSAGHDHGRHEHRSTNRKRLWIAMLLAASYMFAEVIGGVLTGSLALLADAGHMLADVSALALSLFALWFADRPSGPQSTFGHRRVEILAALVNGVALIAIALTIFVEAIERLGDPPEVLGLPMLGVATGGLFVNLAGLWILSGGRSESLNVRGAWLHVMADAMGSVGAMTAGLLVWGFGWTIADPIASIVIGVLVIYSAWSLLRDTVDVLMEKAPRDVQVEEVQRSISEVAGVEAVHDLHVWTVTSGLVALSCHVAATGTRAGDAILSDIQSILNDRFSIRHATIQIESPSVEGQCDPCS